MESLSRGRWQCHLYFLATSSLRHLFPPFLSSSPFPPFLSPLLQCWSDVEDLRREVAILELLSGHDHIVSISDAFEDEGVGGRVTRMGGNWHVH